MVKELELDPKAAAEVIRNEVLSRPDVPAEMRHISEFAKKVCDQLGIEPDATNVMAVVKALQKAGIKPHQAVEYPKMLTDDKGKPVLNEYSVPVVFNDAAEEAAYQPIAVEIEKTVADHQNERIVDDVTRETTAQHNERVADEAGADKRKKK